MANCSVSPSEVAESVIYGLDLGDKRCELFGLDGKTGEVLETGSVACSPQGIGRFFKRLEPAIVAIEAGTHSRWVSEQLESYGHKVIVANPRRVRLITDNDTKSDRLDAERLALLARADPRLLHPIQHRGREAHADLALIRARDRVVEARTKLVNAVRGAVKGFGGRISKMSTRTFHKRACAEIPDELLPALEPLVAVIATLTETIKGYDKLIEGRTEERYPEAKRLQQVVGVGPLTALAFVLTLEDPYRFANGRKVGSYLGLRPKQRASGSSDPQLRITKAGNGHLRRLLVGSAHYVLGPFGPDTDLRRWGNRLVERGGAGAKRKAVVAVARKLGVLLHSLWQTGETYEPLRHTKRRGELVGGV